MIVVGGCLLIPDSELRAKASRDSTPGVETAETGVPHTGETGVSPCVTDADGDGYVTTDCPGGDDCDDAAADVHPGVDDDCDGVDDDCDGYVDGPLAVPDQRATIQAAVEAATDGERICVTAGTYEENVDLLDRDVILQGAGADVTTIRSDGTGRPLTVNDASALVTLGGFTLTGGDSTFGGGLYLDSAGATLEDVTVTGNACTGGANCLGGGIYAVGDISFSSVSVTGNTASPTGDDGGVAGAGVYLYDATGSLSGVRISENVADLAGLTTVGVVSGAGLALSGVSLSIEDLEVSDNRVERGVTSPAVADVYGTGVSADIDESAWTDVLVAGNQAELAGVDGVIGGGMMLARSASFFERVRVVDSRASGDQVYGSALGLTSGTWLTATNLVVANNVAEATTLAIGAIYLPVNSDGTPSLGVTNGDCVANTLDAVTAYGGCVYLDAKAELSLVNVAIVSNVLPGDRIAAGGAVYLSGGDGSSIDISYCNTVDNLGAAYTGFDDPTDTDGNVAVKPGYTDTTSDDAADWDLSLLPESGMIDAGNPDIVDTDGSRSDIGAWGGPNGFGG